MNAELAQAIALVAHGNTFLNNEPGQYASSLEDSNSTFRFVNSVKFLRDERERGLGERASLLVDNTRTWFEDMRSLGARRLWLVIVPPRNTVEWHSTVTLSGGERWGIQVDYPSHLDLSIPSWTPSQSVAESFPEK